MKAIPALLLSALLLVTANAALAKTITLDKDTKLVPQGWTVADDIKFKKNTTAMLNADGELVKGTLASSTYLRPTGWRLLANNYLYVETAPDIFPPRFFRPFPHRYGVVIPADGHVRYKTNTLVTFAEDGTVLSGTIDNDVVLQLSDKAYGFVRFKNDTLLSFYPDGRVRSGVLAENTKLRPVGWKKNLTDEGNGFIEFKSGMRITFDADGLVTQGSLSKKTLWHNADGSSQELEAKAPISFSEDGASVVGEEK